MKTKRQSSAPSIRCPHCGKELAPAFIRAASGRLVGSIKGTAKAHSPEQARAAVMVRWAKTRRERREHNS